MFPLAIATYIAFGLIVVALALVLLTVLARLLVIVSTLRTIDQGLHTIARQVEPLEPVLTDVNANLGAARDALVGVLARKGRSKAEELV